MKKREIPASFLVRIMITIWSARDLVYSMRKDENYTVWHDELEQEHIMLSSLLEDLHDFRDGGEIPQDELYDEWN